MYVKEKQFSVSLLYNFVFHTKIIKATIPSDLSLKVILQGEKKDTDIQSCPLSPAAPHPEGPTMSDPHFYFMNTNPAYQIHFVFCGYFVNVSFPGI